MPWRHRASSKRVRASNWTETRKESFGVILSSGTFLQIGAIIPFPTFKIQPFFQNTT
jgi:hypothetical protein